MVRRDEEQWDPIESLGKTGAVVAKNVRLIRKRRGLAYTELAERLTNLKREIPTWGLRKIESGGRRVDADDLVALSLALGVSPSTLLMPETESADSEAVVTGVEGHVEAGRLWRWLLAEGPLTATGYKAWFEFLSAGIPAWALEDLSIKESGAGPNLTTAVGKRDQVIKWSEASTDGDDQ